MIKRLTANEVNSMDTDIYRAARLAYRLGRQDQQRILEHRLRQHTGQNDEAAVLRDLAANMTDDSVDFHAVIRAAQKGSTTVNSHDASDEAPGLFNSRPSCWDDCGSTDAPGVNPDDLGCGDCDMREDDTGVSIAERLASDAERLAREYEESADPCSPGPYFASAIRTLGHRLEQYDSMLLDAEARAEHLQHEVDSLRAWKDGATGAATISYPPRTGPHTEEAYCAHKDHYERGSEEYRVGADVVAAAVLAAKASDVQRVEVCEWCGEPVNNGSTHGEGRCF